MKAIRQEKISNDAEIRFYVDGSSRRARVTVSGHGQTAALSLSLEDLINILDATSATISALLDAKNTEKRGDNLGNSDIMP